MIQRLDLERKEVGEIEGKIGGKSDWSSLNSEDAQSEFFHDAISVRNAILFHIFRVEGCDASWVGDYFLNFLCTCEGRSFGKWKLKKKKKKGSRLLDSLFKSFFLLL